MTITRIDDTKKVSFIRVFLYRARPKFFSHYNQGIAGCIPAQVKNKQKKRFLLRIAPICKRTKNKRLLGSLIEGSFHFSSSQDLMIFPK